MQGTAGNVVPPPEFLPAIAELARAHGALLIADEMITGFGRTGEMFGVQHTGVTPDIMTLGKSLGGGFPVSAVLTRSEIASAKPWSKPSFSSSSYGGNPLASAAVAASVRVIRDQNLPERARGVGKVLRHGLQQLSERYRSVVNVRGEGLMLGFDLVQQDAEPWPSPRCLELFQALLRRGMLTMAYAPRVRVNPPLIFTHQQAHEAIEILDAGLAEVGA